MNIAGAHTQAVLNKLSKPELVQIILNTEASLGSQIAKWTTEVNNLLDHSKKLEADVAIVRNVNNKLVERVVATEHQCWENAQYSRRDTLEVVGIPILLEIMFLSRKFATWFRKLAWIFVIVTFRPVIVGRIKTEQMSNLPTEKIAFEFWGWKGNWKVLILQRRSCLKEPKFLLMRACALIIEGYGTNVKN